ncbi:sigma-54-dependent Fis family transcriptional regulator [Pyrinomonas methylaliphatogenes]|jgi:transcriptional regulator with GAF, ATPase, and Fis domain|nr:sigma 54-interacting transcriptional regulator [Pyrinomonas methylaliphatogenes]MBX5479416.1 sigma 54-interacting transcriptional regulator [Pyrinomonas methylaliphatogenes]
MSSTVHTLSLERKIRMHEAREAIIERLAPDLHSEIDLDKFLHAIVCELGRMMDVDRCDVIHRVPTGQWRISHEWRVSDDIPSSLGITIPVDIEQLSKRLDLTQPIRLDDASSPELDPRARELAASLGTRSLLIVPVVLGGQVLGFVGLHTTRAPRIWLDEEVAFLQSIARQIAVGYQYARLYTDKQREADRTRALLEIANALNARSDFSEVTSLVIERAIALVSADYGALGVVDHSNRSISLAAFHAAPHATVRGVEELIATHGRSIDLAEFPALMELLAEGRTLKLLDKDLPLPIRLVFNAQLHGRAALVAPVRIKEQVFGLLGLVWSEARDGFAEHEVTLVEGIADQIGTALERDQLSAEVMRLRSVIHERRAESRIIGQAPAIRRAIELALNVADTQTSVLIQGESGTGKELLADLIHYSSQRKDKPYIKLNCGAIPETLLESELFGHEKGAFTDARARRRGRFEEADGGTLFLDEIGEMSLSAQVRLLRVLQDGEFTRVGGNQVLKTDVRVIAASNVDLARAVEEGRFRRDLYYRLSVFPIYLPPLRERAGDIHPLVIHFIEHYKQKTGRFISGISREALQALINYDWPGNVRELENAIERAVIIAAGRQIELEDLPEAICRHWLEHRRQARRARSLADGPAVKLELEVPMSMDEIERRAIEATLNYTQGDKTRAARLLGIGRKTLYRKLQRYELALADSRGR